MTLAAADAGGVSTWHHWIEAIMASSNTIITAATIVAV
jgi:hypothetical protein